MQGAYGVGDGVGGETGGAGDGAEEAFSRSRSLKKMHSFSTPSATVYHFRGNFSTSLLRVIIAPQSRYSPLAISRKMLSVPLIVVKYSASTGALRMLK